jgi:hypothetical protein
MQGNTIVKVLALAFGGVLLAGCNDEPTSPEQTGTGQASANADASLVPPPGFIIQAPLDAFFINQPSELMMRSDARTDFVIQRLVTPPGPPGNWHTHPGPLFTIVDQGRVMITRYSKKDGCVSTIYGPGEPAGQTYTERAGEVHRATVIGAVTSVEYKARFYVPVGGSLGTGAADPGCT